jgi:hypothetical protein
MTPLRQYLRDPVQLLHIASARSFFGFGCLLFDLSASVTASTSLYLPV